MRTLEQRLEEAEWIITEKDKDIAKLQAYALDRAALERARSDIERLSAMLKVNDNLLGGIGEPDNPYWRVEQRLQRAANAAMIEEFNGCAALAKLRAIGDQQP